MSERFMTPQEVADELRVDVRTLHSWRRRNAGPPAQRIGKYLRYNRAAYEAWLAGEVRESERLAAERQPAHVPGQRRLKGVD